MYMHVTVLDLCVKHACFRNMYIHHACFKKPVRVSYACFSKIAYASCMQCYFFSRCGKKRCISDVYLLKITYSLRNHNDPLNSILPCTLRYAYRFIPHLLKNHNYHVATSMFVRILKLLKAYRIINCNKFFSSTYPLVSLS